MNATHRVSALQLTGILDSRVSRWLWLVKMFLGIPHFIVLAALWVGVIFVTLMAGASIVATGRYPRRLFDFTVGVLRWNWRVGFYVYAALGTDRYPPFSFDPADYPATLDVAYPAQLSRIQVLSKWLLAIPHVIVVWLFGATLLLYPIPALNDISNGPLSIGAYSVLNLLVVIAGFFLLVTGAYPNSLFDFLMGLNRWVYRVIVYVALMTDDYPPFRLDAGSADPTASTAGRS